MKGAQAGGVFVDWVTIVERHPEGGLPRVLRGLHSWFDANGVCRRESLSAAHLGGSWSSTVLVGCDGFSTFLSGNVGRFHRKDNLFNLGWSATLAKCDRILAHLGLPAFTVARRVSDEGANESAFDIGPSPAGGVSSGARLLRVDITRNFSTGSDAQAKALIRSLQGLTLARCGRGAKGEWGVYWANTRRMVKAYLKGQDLAAHGGVVDQRLVEWVTRQGVVRVEVEMKRRELQALGLNYLGDVSDAKLAAIFEEESAFLSRPDRSDEPDILMEIPTRSRCHAAAWIKGQDLRALLPNGTFYRHAKVLKEYGIDITQRRDIHNFPVKVRVVDLCPLSAPEWYEWDEAA